MYLSKLFQYSPERLCFGLEINYYMGHYILANRENDTTKNWSTSGGLGSSHHLRTLRQWELKSYNPHDVLGANMPLPWTFRSFSETNTSRWPSLPSLQNDDCTGTLWTWSTGSKHNLSLSFVVKNGSKANIWEEIANIPSDMLVLPWSSDRGSGRRPFFQL